MRGRFAALLVGCGADAVRERAWVSVRILGMVRFPATTRWVSSTYCRTLLHLVRYAGTNQSTGKRRLAKTEETDRINTSPRVPTDCPSWYSSVLAICDEHRVRSFARRGECARPESAWGERTRKRCSESRVGRVWSRKGTDLQVHVVVCRDEVALVLHPPLQADVDGFPGQIGEERFRVDDLRDAPGERDAGSAARDRSLCMAWRLTWSDMTSQRG